MGSDSHEDDEEKTSGVEGPSSEVYSHDNRHQRLLFFLVQTKINWCTLLIIWYSR